MSNQKNLTNNHKYTVKERYKYHKNRFMTADTSSLPDDPKMGYSLGFIEGCQNDPALADSISVYDEKWNVAYRNGFMRGKKARQNLCNRIFD